MTRVLSFSNFIDTISRLHLGTGKNSLILDLQMVGHEHAHRPLDLVTKK
jgi:hypothetical protein